MEKREYVGVSFSGDQRWRIFQDIYIDCSFVGADLFRAELIGTFIGCDFSCANLNEAVLGDEFEDCWFDEVSD